MILFGQYYKTICVGCFRSHPICESFIFLVWKYEAKLFEAALFYKDVFLDPHVRHYKCCDITDTRYKENVLDCRDLKKNSNRYNLHYTSKYKNRTNVTIRTYNR